MSKSKVLLLCHNPLHPFAHHFKTFAAFEQFGYDGEREAGSKCIPLRQPPSLASIELGTNADEKLYEESLDRVYKKIKGKSPNRYISLGGEGKPEGYITHLGNYQSVVKGQIIATKPDHVLVASENYTTFIWSNDQYEDIFGWKLHKI